MKTLIDFVENKIEISLEKWNEITEYIKTKPQDYKYFAHLVSVPEQINLAELAMELDPSIFEFIRLELGMFYDPRTEKQYKNILELALNFNIENMKIISYKLTKQYYYKKRFDIEKYNLDDKKELFNVFAYCYAIDKQTTKFIPKEIYYNISFQLYMLDVFGPEYNVPNKVLQSKESIIINKLYNDYNEGRIEIQDIMYSKYGESFNELLNNLQDYTGKTFEDFEIKADQNLQKNYSLE